MNKQEVIAFFDHCAPGWDADQVDRSTVINTILDNARVGEGDEVLDVACGTGVMFPYYLSRGVASVTGIDISGEMAKRAAEKFADEPRVSVRCGDVEETIFGCRFDHVVVYNAFPHFPDPSRLIGRLSLLLKPEGRLTIAHGWSRDRINAHHAGAAQKVSNGLMEAEELAALFAPYFTVDTAVSDAEMYQVSGTVR